MQLKIKSQWIFLIFPFLMYSCGVDQKGKKQNRATTDLNINSNFIPELSPEQESAFEALNTLQVRTDELNQLYSTFADIHQPCYPPDTSFVISQSEFLIALKIFVEEFCKNMSDEERDSLSKLAVLAQPEYKVLYCSTDGSISNYKNGLPRIGTWVMPGVLGRRDIILNW